MSRVLHAWVVVAFLGMSAAALAQQKHEDKGAGFEDTLITERVTSALGADPALKRLHISVATRDGVVHLTGFVDSMAQLERAAALARGVEGVSAVKNAIRVSNRPARA